jgi:hypothetical protein
VITVPSVFITLTIFIALFLIRNKIPELLNQLTKFIKSVKVGNAEFTFSEFIENDIKKFNIEQRLSFPKETLESIVNQKISLNYCTRSVG